MTASPRRRRNRTLTAALSGVFVLVAAPLIGYVGWNVLQDSKAGTAVETLDEVDFPSTPTAMMAIVDDKQVITSLAVMVLRPRDAQGSPARGGTLVVVPTNASSAQTAAEEQIPIADSMINKGETGVVADTESLMRVTLLNEAILDETAVAALFQSIGPVSATLPNDVVRENGDGSTETLFVSGAAELSPTDTASVLTARVEGEPESKRLPNVRAVWSALAQRVGEGIDPEGVTTPEPTDFNDFMKHFLGGPIQVVNDLTTTPLTGTLNPDHRDVGGVDVSSVVLLMATIAPSAMLVTQDTVTFRIENGLTAADIAAVGLEGVTPNDVSKDLVQRLLFLKGDVISVSSQVFTPEEEQVPGTTTIYSTVEFQSGELETFSDSLGEVDIVDATFQFPLVDAVIVIGKSYLEDMAEKRASTGSDATDVTGSTDATGTSDVVDTDVAETGGTGTGVATTDSVSATVTS